MRPAPVEPIQGKWRASTMPRIAPVTLALGILLLASMPIGPSVANAGAGTFTPPLFSVGETAAYTGPFTLSIEPPTTVIDKASRTVEAFGIRQGTSTVNYISPRSMTQETRSGCAVDVDGDCVMHKFLWWDQGTPGALGATLLQGRAFAIGDSWTIQGECVPCRAPLVVTVEPAQTGSPAGTAYVAKIQGNYGPSGFDLWRVSGRIHMGTSHAFPLRLDLDDGRSFTLTAHTPGSTSIFPVSTPEPATYIPPLPFMPFENRRPYEGTPPAGWPSWAEARAATGPDPIDTDPNASFVSLLYFQGREHLGISSFRVVNLTRFALIATEFNIPGQDNIEVQYDYKEPAPADVDLGKDKAIWASETDTSAPSTPGSCPDQGPPIWDTVQLGWSFGFLHELQGVLVTREGAGPQVPLCTTPILQLIGKPTGLVVPPNEHLRYNFTTGYLHDTWYLGE